MSEPDVRQEMAVLAQGRKGIPVVRLGGEVAVGFDRRWLRSRLGLA